MTTTVSSPALHTDVTVLKQLTAIRLDVAIWTARRKLSAADFGNAGLPPEKLASLGSKRVCNPEDLRIFAALKARAVSLLERTGVRFLGGWAIPEAQTSGVVRELSRIGAAFEEAKTAFLARYDEAIRQWIADNPGWEALIAGSTVGLDTVRSRLAFGWQVFQVAPPRGKGKAAFSAALTTEVNGLAGTLFDEVAKSAAETWRKSYEGKAEVSQKALSPLRGLRAKLTGLSFVEPRVMPVADLIQSALVTMPAKGPIGGMPLRALHGVFGLLRDPEALVAYGQRILDGEDSADILRELALAQRGADAGEAPLPSETNDTPDTAPFADDTVPAGGPCLDSLGLW
jgi:hypothetical protein